MKYFFCILNITNRRAIFFIDLDLIKVVYCLCVPNGWHLKCILPIYAKQMLLDVENNMMHLSKHFFLRSAVLDLLNSLCSDRNPSFVSTRESIRAVLFFPKELLFSRLFGLLTYHFLSCQEFWEGLHGYSYPIKYFIKPHKIMEWSRFFSYYT